MNLREYLREHGADHFTRPLRDDCDICHEEGDEDDVESEE